jgi:hypothetical protein
MTEERLTRSEFIVERLPTLDDIDDLRSLARFLTRAGRNELSDLTKEIATLLSTAPIGLSNYIKRLPDVMLTGWRGLRAPPDILHEMGA